MTTSKKGLRASKTSYWAFVISNSSAVCPTLPGGAALVLRKVRICFHLVNLLGVPLAVGCAEKQEFISVPFLPKRTVRQMLAQIRSRLHQLDGLRPAFQKMIERFGGSPA